jgi:plastocyanin
MRYTVFASFAAAAAFAMASCGGGGGYSAPAPTPTTPAPTPTPTSVTVTIVGSSGNKAFTPNPVMANAGDTLVFKNDTMDSHRLIMNDGSADIGEIAPGSSKSLTVKGSGGLFHCTIHSTMIGSINGSAPPPEPPCTTPGYC